MFGLIPCSWFYQRTPARLPEDAVRCAASGPQTWGMRPGGSPRLAQNGIIGHVGAETARCLTVRAGSRQPSHPDKGWLASYADMVTVLMCLLVVPFAMSRADANKFEKLGTPD